MTTTNKRGILPDGWAALNRSDAGRKYRPSNGAEGEFFFSAWCRGCARDKSMSEGFDYDECDDDQRCDIIGRTFAHDVDDPEYPKEWCYGMDGQPCCTAFVPVGEPIPPVKCEHTFDMFSTNEED